MKNFASIESAIAPKDLVASAVRSLKKLGLKLPSSAWVGFMGILLSVTMLAAQLVAQSSALAAQIINRDVRIAGTVNVRSGPSTGYRVIGTFYPGQTVRVTGLSNGWYQTPDGRWFSSNYAYTTHNTSTTGFGVGGGGTPTNRVVTVTGSVVNVRNGPGTNYGLNGRPVYRGERLRVVNVSSNGWYQLPDGGWFSSSFATSGGVGGGGSAGTVINRDVTVATTVNVRSGPGTGYRIIGTFYPGQSVRVTGLSNGWYQTPDGRWFSSNYAYATHNTSTTGFGVGGGGSAARVSTNGSALLIRSSPGGSVIGSYSNGTVVRLTGQYSGGYAQLSSGGWVSSAWLN